MITDQQLATREREISKLFLGLRAPSQRQNEVDQADDQVSTPSQRIEQILRRVQLEADAPDRLPRQDRGLQSPTDPSRSEPG